MNEPSTTYHDRLQNELVAASRRLHRQHEAAQAPGEARREPRLRVRFALGSTVGIALAAGIAALVIVLGAGTQRAFAEWSRWTAAPTTPAEGQTAAAEQACLAKTGVAPSPRQKDFGAARWLKRSPALGTCSSLTRADPSRSCCCSRRIRTRSPRAWQVP